MVVLALHPSTQEARTVDLCDSKAYLAYKRPGLREFWGSLTDCSSRFWFMAHCLL